MPGLQKIDMVKRECRLKRRGHKAIYSKWGVGWGDKLQDLLILQTFRAVSVSDCICSLIR